MGSFNRNTAHLLAGAVAALLLASCGGSNDTPAAPPLFSKVYVVGTSTSDNGNACNLVPQEHCTPSPPYATPRYSDGLLFNEFLAARYGASMTPSRFGGTNYAYSGARTGPIAGTTQSVPNLLTQTEQYLAAVGYQSNPQYLYVVDGVAFGDDITDALTLASKASSQAAALKIVTDIVTSGVTNMVTVINRLYASGARHILVTNVTDAGKTPRAKATDSVFPGASATATSMSLQFNGALAQQIAAIRAGSPGLNVYLVDVAGFTLEALANPAAFGYTNVTAPCFNDLLPTPTLCATPATYFYWDSYHGTAVTNNWVYQRAVKLLPI
jgi:outer membrane lipase/esterase